MSARDILMSAAGGTPLAANFIEDVFSTYLYTGNGSTQTITNGIDLAGEGGLVWVKSRTNTESNTLQDTVRGTSSVLISDATYASLPFTTNITAFNSNGFSIGTGSGTSTNGQNYASWTFRKQPKFFDVVTYTGNGVAGRTVAHNLGSTPGCIIVKCTSASSQWPVYHRSLGGGTGNGYAWLNQDAAAAVFGGAYWGTGGTNLVAPTSTTFTVSDDGGVNATGNTYVAYLFAHDAGGFGLTGTDNVISCGSFTTSGAGTATVNLGYEPQWLMLKNSTSADNWYVLDNMRGFSMSQGISLNPNLSAAESDYFGGNTLTPNATGFSINNNIGAGATWIYIAIRRGPMKVPTSGTSVFAPVLVTSSAADQNVDAGFPVDLVGIGWRNAGLGVYFVDRLRGITSSSTPRLAPPSTAAEQLTNNISGAYQTGVTQYTGGQTGYDLVDWFFRRAPGFFDEVCYTGTGVARTVAHNLTVPPELMIVKSRSTSARSWIVYAQALGATKGFYLEEPDAAIVNSLFWNNTAPTSSVFTVNTSASVNGSGSTFVAYLFASCPGVSKVGSYTGTGTTQTINCGFTAGARFVLIKRTDSTGDWYVWDSARGIVAGNDPYLLLNSTAAEVTNTDFVDTAASGFEISSTAPAAINASGGSFIFLAIA